jgi:hypothetical protein
LSVGSCQEGFSAIITFEVPIGRYVVYNVALTGQNLMKKDKRKILTYQQLIRFTKILNSSKSWRSVSIIISASGDRVDFLGLSILHQD